MQPKIRFASCAFLFFMGCGLSVPITYLKLKPGADQESLRNVYLQIKLPKNIGTTSTTKGLYLQEENLAHTLDPLPIVKRIASELERRGGRLAAYRIQSETDPFLPYLNPTSILEMEWCPPTLSQDKLTDYRTEKWGDKKITKEIPYWMTKAQMEVRASLRSYPQGTEILSNQKRFEASKRHDQEGKNDLDERYQTLVTEMTNSVFSDLLPGVLPVQIVTRSRKIYKVDSDPQSKLAYEKFEKKSSEQEAVDIWSARVKENPSRWQDALNLAAWAEKNLEYDKARRYYEQAQQAMASDKNAPSLAWDEIFDDLKNPLSTQNPTNDSTPFWFNRKVAVLPYTDVSTSIDGPVNVRKLTQTWLEKNGYQAIPLEVVDVRLREQGYTQGGQLRNVPPEKIAGWLKADVLIYGHLDQFDEFTLGFAGWKRLNGQLKMWSAYDKKFIWESDKSVSRTSTTTAKKWADVGFSFLEQLADSWADKASKTPMAKESAYFVEEHLSELPRRPPSQ